MCSAISPVLQEPPEAASEMPIRIKKTFPRRVSDFIPCDKCFYLACSSWCSSSAGLAWARALAVTHNLGQEQQLLHPKISSGTSPHLGSAREWAQGMKCITWGRTPLLQAENSGCSKS